MHVAYVSVFKGFTILAVVDLPRVLLVVDVDVQLAIADRHQSRLIVFNVDQCGELGDGQVDLGGLERIAIQHTIADTIAVDTSHGCSDPEKCGVQVEGSCSDVLIGIIELFRKLNLKSACVDDELASEGDHDIKLVALAVLVDEDPLDSEVLRVLRKLHCSDQFRSFFFVIIEIPQTNLAA